MPMPDLSNVIHADFGEHSERLAAEAVAEQLSHTGSLTDIRFARRIKDALEGAE